MILSDHRPVTCWISAQDDDRLLPAEANDRIVLSQVSTQLDHPHYPSSVGWGGPQCSPQAGPVFRVRFRSASATVSLLLGPALHYGMPPFPPCPQCQVLADPPLPMGPADQFRCLGVGLTKTSVKKQLFWGSTKIYLGDQKQIIET